MRISFYNLLVVVFIVLNISFCCAQSNENSLYIENVEGNSYFGKNRLNISGQVMNILSTSLANKKIDPTELVLMRDFIHNLSLKYPGTVFVINKEGIVIAHYNKEYEMTNIREYSDFKNGLNKVLDRDDEEKMIMFFYNVKIYSPSNKYMMMCHVSAEYIDELNIIIVTLSAY